MKRTIHRTGVMGGLVLLVLWLASVLGSLAFSAFLMWAAFHFIVKYW